jgi:hypothetical protein
MGGSSLNVHPSRQDKKEAGMRKMINRRAVQRCLNAFELRIEAHRRMMLRYLRRPTKENLAAAVAAFAATSPVGGQTAIDSLGRELQALVAGDQQQWLRLLGAALRDEDRRFYLALKRLSPFRHMLIAVVDRDGETLVVRGDIDRLLDAWRRRGLKYAWGSGGRQVFAVPDLVIRPKDLIQD